MWLGFWWGKPGKPHNQEETKNPGSSRSSNDSKLSVHHPAKNSKSDMHVPIAAELTSVLFERLTIYMQSEPLLPADACLTAN
jgi:hypothetical protein